MPIFLSICIVVLDQVVKFLVTHEMFPGMSIPVIQDVFHITFVLNPGAAFGILAHQRSFFIVMGIVIVILGGLFSPYIRRQCRIFRCGTALLLGGALGNLIDRVRFGHVIDFFDFRIWPVFNIADIAIVVGVAAIIYAILFKMHPVEDA
ncbi:signal peptidase II [uncultured Selenomonas sp.]|uniref:signal peptidase II n=1 Tax=uncultured Selenomonas sp. TaxID=159275 RepID=UPI0028D53058|nr:signal peptidase II [uncultured Selenomonas sp.]